LIEPSLPIRIPFFTLDRDWQCRLPVHIRAAFNA
jgi:hypothetical protein